MDQEPRSICLTRPNTAKPEVDVKMCLLCRARQDKHLPFWFFSEHHRLVVTKIFPSMGHVAFTVFVFGLKQETMKQSSQHVETLWLNKL